MSRVQPPGRPVPLSTPFGNENAWSGGGHVVSAGLISVSIVNHLFGNALEKPCAASVHVAVSGGEVRLTSFCRRHVYALPAWSTCVVCAASALDRKSTRL